MAVRNNQTARAAIHPHKSERGHTHGTFLDRVGDCAAVGRPSRSRQTTSLDERLQPGATLPSRSRMPGCMTNSYVVPGWSGLSGLKLAVKPFAET